MTAFFVFQLTSDHIRPVVLPDLSSLDAITRQLPSGFYTTFRTFDHRRRVLGLRLHLQRLYAPARCQGIQPAVEEGRLRQRMAEVLSGFPYEARVRTILTHQGELYLAIEPFSPLPHEVYSQGVRVITVPLRRIRPTLKATSFIETSQQARQRVQESGAFEALMIFRGRILEGLTSNFFYMRDGCLRTARRGVLPGVTRRIVLRLARGRGIEVQYRSLELAELSQISEAFLTSSSRGVVPIVQIDDHRVGEGRVGKITYCLSSAYEDYWRRHAEPFIE